jgi:MFS family permease
MTDAPAGAEARVRSRTFAALANPDYRRYYLGQGVSLIGTWLQTAAVRWIVFEKTGSVFMNGVIEAAGVMPGMLVGLVAGALADRVAPKGMILLMQVGQMLLAFALAALVGLGIEQIWQMAAILALTRVCVTFEMPSRQVFLYDVVGRPSLMNAIALNTGLFNASRVIGPALAGVCLAKLGATSCFALNGVSYLAAIAALLSIRRPHLRGAKGTSGSGELLGGLAYLRRDRRVATLFLLMGFFGVVGMGYDAMVPAYARRVVLTGVRGYSLLLSSSGIGATCGALAVASLGGLRRKERLVLTGMVIFAASLGCAAWLPARIGPSGARLATATACLFGVGAGAVIFYSATQTLIQTAVPDHLRGRVMGIWMIVFSGSVPLGSLWTGRLALGRGVPPVMGLSACLCALAAMVVLASGALTRTTALPLHGDQAAIQSMPPPPRP